MTTTMIASMTTTKTTTTVVLTIAVVWCAPSSTISSNSLTLQTQGVFTNTYYDHLLYRTRSVH